MVRLLSGPIRILKWPLFEAKKILYYHRTFDEYIRLRENVNVLGRRLAGMEEIIRENDRLTKLLNFKRKLVYASTPATVIGRDPTQWNATLVIDKGGDDGIRAGYPVVNAAGVVGKIVEVSRTASKIILLTDGQFSVAAFLPRSQ